MIKFVSALSAIDVVDMIFFSIKINYFITSILFVWDSYIVLKVSTGRQDESGRVPRAHFS